MNIDEILLKNKQLEEENIDLKEKLKKYTAPKRSKNYYENHKEEVIKKVKEYREKTNYHYEIPSDKKKEYARTAYLNKKEKQKKQKENTESENI